jgi:3-hydroxybutyryl-CoA dehydrogenase
MLSTDLHFDTFTCNNPLMNCVFTHIGIVGTGAMGQGIAQIAAQAGAQVLLFDMSPNAATKACETLQATWRKPG